MRGCRSRERVKISNSGRAPQIHTGRRWTTYEHCLLHGVLPVAASHAAFADGVSRFGHRLEPRGSNADGEGTSGTAPVSWLPCTLNDSRLVNPASEGSVPVSWLPCTMKYASFGNPLS